MLNEKNWIESNKNEIEIKDYSYSVYYSFIKYLYTDCVEFKTEDCFELLDLANCYLEEELKTRCAEIIKSQITIENVIEIYFSAVKYDSKLLKKYCREIFRNNIIDDNNADKILESAAKKYLK